MSDLKITGLQPGRESGIKAGGKDPEEGFNDILQESIGKITRIQNEADNAVKELATGGDITNAIIAMEKADMSFQLMVEIRNKLLSAYEEVMRMQV